MAPSFINDQDTHAPLGAPAAVVTSPTSDAVASGEDEGILDAKALQVHRAVLEKKSRWLGVVMPHHFRVSTILSRVNHFQWPLDGMEREAAPSADLRARIRVFETRIIEFVKHVDAVTLRLVALQTRAAHARVARAFNGFSVDVARVEVDVAALEAHVAELALALAKLETDVRRK